MAASDSPDPTRPADPTGPTAGRHRIGSAADLRAAGYLTGKAGTQPVCVFWCSDDSGGGDAYAVEDRCPHLGFPLHRGSVEGGLLTCHWHHARFDLVSGGTLDPFADDVPAYPVELDGDDVVVVTSGATDAAAHHRRRLEEGLEQGLSLVLAKAVLGLTAAVGEAGATEAALATGLDFGLRYHDRGWDAGLTVLTAMANVLDRLDPADRPLALVHGLRFVANDTRGSAPHFPMQPLPASLPADRLESWYRRFVDTRNGDAAERTIATAAAASAPTIPANPLGTPATPATPATSAGTPQRLAAVLGAAATDHVFVDGGHTIDFVNKAFEAIEHVGWEKASVVLPSLAHQMASASRSEETGSWRHPHDLASLLARASAGLPARLARSSAGAGPAPAGAGPAGAGTPARGAREFKGDADVDALAHAVLGEDPEAIVAALDDALDRGATAEELARAVAYAASLRIGRFHVQNDFGDWDVVHHAFTSANAVHQLVRRAPTPDVVRGVYQGALRIYLDRFLNVPPARHPAQAPLPTGDPDTPADDPQAALALCWDRQGMVDEAGGVVYRWVTGGAPSGQPAAVAALGSALLAEDAGFHWFQTYEAAVRQADAWPAGSEQAALILAGAARWIAAHTPTRRELPQVVRIAARLGRGDPLYDLAGDGADDGADERAAGAAG